MSSSSLSNNLNSLLLVQETLRPTVTGAASLSDALITAISIVAESSGCRDGRLVLVNQKRSATTTITLKDGQAQYSDTDTMQEALTRGIEGWVLREGQVRLSGDTKTDDAWIAGPHPATNCNSWSMLCVPITAGESIVGVLTLLKTGKNQFDHDSVAFPSLFANQLGNTLEAIQIRSTLQQSSDRYQNLLLERQDFAAVLVHDLQVPVGNVVTSLEMIKEEIGLNDDSNLSFMIDIAARSSKQLQSLVDSLLDISRLEAGQEIRELKAVAVKELVDHVLEVEALVFEQRQVRAIRKVSSNLPPILANAGMLQRVLLNLVDNALKASKQNQSITIRADHKDGDSAVRICVDDQGPGIPEDYRERIFEKYQRVERIPSSKGLGLGLAFCKLAVDAHRGRIWVEDSPNGGACFCLMIPVADASIPSS